MSKQKSVDAEMKVVTCNCTCTCPKPKSTSRKVMEFLGWLYLMAWVANWYSVK